MASAESPCWALFIQPETETMDDIIGSVATLLGWINDYGDGDFDLIYNGHTYHGGRPDCVIHFAAYAKAEMARRGWTPFAEGTTVGYSIQFFDEYGEQANGDGQTTSCHDYDPSDPIAEANAALSAIAEALSLQPNASHQGPASAGPAE
jgi:hypothetical protein